MVLLEGGGMEGMQAVTPPPGTKFTHLFTKAGNMRQDSKHYNLVCLKEHDAGAHTDRAVDCGEKCTLVHAI